MRGVQLVRMVQPFLRSDITLKALPYKLSDRWGVNNLLFGRRQKGVVVLLKSLAYSLSLEALDNLRRNSISLGVDHIDADLQRCRFSEFDFHISASLTGYKALKKISSDTHQHVGYVIHHADPRIEHLVFKRLPHFRALYFGNPQNLVLPPTLNGYVDSMTVTTNPEMIKALPNLPNYNFHLNVRPPYDQKQLLRVYKPFTKGVNAAACKSNIMVHRDTDDALEMLGEDYPFLLHSQDALHVEEIFRHAQDSFGGKVWNLGLERMEHLRQQTSPSALARQLEAVVDAVI